MVDLGVGTAAAIRDGHQVGSASNHAALWSGTADSLVDLNPANWTQSVAVGVRGGQQVGSATRQVQCNVGQQCGGDRTKTEFHPFLWFGSAASAVDLTPLVTLASNNPAAMLPASVLIPAGQTSATFTVQTSAVTNLITATLRATYGVSTPVTKTATLAITPSNAQGDTVAIQKADYEVAKKQLRVQATSTSLTATLTVSVTATRQVIGILTNKGAGQYAGTFALATNPQNITVTSNLTGKASRTVSLK